MELDRDSNTNGKGKYALIKLREIEGFPQTKEKLSQSVADNPDCIDFGFKGDDSEFFVIRLKDKHATKALIAYLNSVLDDGDLQFANSMYDMINRAMNHKNKKTPD